MGNTRSDRNITNFKILINNEFVVAIPDSYGIAGVIKNFNVSTKKRGADQNCSFHGIKAFALPPLAKTSNPRGPTEMILYRHISTRQPYQKDMAMAGYERIHTIKGASQLQ